MLELHDKDLKSMIKMHQQEIISTLKTHGKTALAKTKKKNRNERKPQQRNRSIQKNQMEV